MTGRQPETPDLDRGGECQGGAYPNPHKGRDVKQGGAPGHGGQGAQAYHGTGQLGRQKTGDNANAASRD